MRRSGDILAGMRLSIPSTIGLLTLSVAPLACSDAERAVTELERLCKARCDCPDFGGEWMEVSNCKKQCEAESKISSAFIRDAEDIEVCDDLNARIKASRECRQQSCDAFQDCYSESRWDITGCVYVYSYYYDGGPGADGESFRGSALADSPDGPRTLEQLLTPIPADDPPLMSVSPEVNDEV